jgi:hypothetical protein
MWQAILWKFNVQLLTTLEIVEVDEEDVLPRRPHQRPANTGKTRLLLTPIG